MLKGYSYWDLHDPCIYIVYYRLMKKYEFNSTKYISQINLIKEICWNTWLNNISKKGGAEFWICNRIFNRFFSVWTNFIHRLKCTNIQCINSLLQQLKYCSTRSNLEKVFTYYTHTAAYKGQGEMQCDSLSAVSKP